MNTILINRQNVLVKQYKGQRVLTFKDIDMVHGRTDGTARRNFNSNKKHFVEGEDFFKISPDEFRRTIAPKRRNYAGFTQCKTAYHRYMYKNREMI